MPRIAWDFSKAEVGASLYVEPALVQKARKAAHQYGATHGRRYVIERQADGGALLTRLTDKPSGVEVRLLDMLPIGAADGIPTNELGGKAAARALARRATVRFRPARFRVVDALLVREA